MANPLKEIKKMIDDPMQAVVYDLPSGTRDEYKDRLRDFKGMIDQYLDGQIRSKHIALAAFELAFWQFKRSYGGGFHPSEVSKGDYCKRKLYFEYVGTEPEKSRSFSQQTMRIFNLGTMVHLYMQYVLLKEKVITDFEVPVVSKTLGINGSADGENTAEEITFEIKTMSSFIFAKLVEPVKEHVRQATMYAYPRGMKRIRLIYVNKDSLELKTFLVPLDMDFLNQFAEVVFELKTLKKENEKSGVETLPEKRCKNRMDNRALECPFANKCFEA